MWAACPAPLNTCAAAQVFSPRPRIRFQGLPGFCPVHRSPRPHARRTLPRRDLFPGRRCGDGSGAPAGYDDTNNTSIVLRVDFGETSFLFTGDMERDAEADLLSDGCDVSCTVLKVGHHGSSTSTSYPFLRAAMPEYAVISVGEDNSYGHPHEETLSRLYDAGCTVYRTDRLGTVVAVSDGTDVSFLTERSGSPETGRGDTSGSAYIGNRNSQVFHRETCANLPAEQNRVTF